ncbi:MAG TPA: lipopolysaccharide heptosyltransferase II [Tepidisphaeraceae bacterium]|nr:lipopolysaccharide heptosyltransferase II [Tepidisphaeraceae bacterium]
MRATSPPIFEKPPQRVLIIKPSAIGDVVHALPVLNLLRRRWPDAHISWLVTPACAGLLDGHPQINEVILFDRKRYGRSWRSPSALRDLSSFNRSLKSQKFDLVIDLQGLFRSGWLTWRTHAPVRVGSTSAREFSWVFCTHLAQADMNGQHAIDRYLNVAEFLGLGRGPVEFVFPTDDRDRQYIKTLLPPGEKFAVLLPATNWPTKQWPIERFAAMTEPLREKYGFTSVLAGGPDAVPLAASLPGAINLAGKTNLRQLVALLERASLVIANDTGPMHIAAALGRPLVTMFGPTSPVRTGPYQQMDSVVRLDIPCSPCFSRRCSHQSCLRWLEADPVLRLAEEQLHVSSSTHIV